MNATHTVLAGLAAAALVVIVLAVGVAAAERGWRHRLTRTYTQRRTRGDVRWMR